MLPSELREYFIDVLAAFYGPPKNAEALAVGLAGKAPPTLMPDELKACAHHLLETHKSNTWPLPPAMFAALNWRPPTNPPPHRKSYSNTAELNRERERDKAEFRALKLLRTSPLAAKAITELWAPALIEFITRNGREPSPEEEAGLIAISERNNADVANQPGTLGERLQSWRQTMHQSAAARLDLPMAVATAQPRSSEQPAGEVEARRRLAEQNLARLQAEANDPDFALAEQLAPTPQLLKALADKATLDAYLASQRSQPEE